jgi:hypothetical protein
MCRDDTSTKADGKNREVSLPQPGVYLAEIGGDLYHSPVTFGTGEEESLNADLVNCVRVYSSHSVQNLNVTVSTGEPTE